jgi:hypothetical protein
MRTSKKHRESIPARLAKNRKTLYDTAVRLVGDTRYQRQAHFSGYQKRLSSYLFDRIHPWA